MKRLSAYLLILSLLPAGALAQSKMLAKPKSGYVLDKASLLNPATIQKIEALSKASEQERQSPIYVVTIPSLESVRADDIEIYANELFDNWAIGTRAANKGILLVVSKGDRKARIALGAHWKYSMDDHCAEIMNRKIVPRFKSGDYPGGILVGVQGLMAMANMGQQASKPYSPPRSSGSNSHTPVGQAPPNYGHPHPPSGITETYYPESSFPTGMSPAGSINLSSFGMLCPVGCILPFGFIILVMLANAASGGRSRGYRDDDDSGWFSSNSSWNRRHDHHRHHHGGFGGSRSGSFGGGSSSSSSSRGSGSSGGGFTGGGGASGSW